MEFLSNEPREEDDSPSGVPARARFGIGTAKACAPPTAYDVNALVLLLAAAARRPGDLDLRAFALRLLGDLVRAIEAKGDVEPEKASKPVRFVAVGTDADESPMGDAKAGTVGRRDN